MSLGPLELAMLAAAGLVAGFVNVVAGGGSLLTMPLMVFLGLPEGVANATARVAIFVQNVSAVTRYRRSGQLDLGAVKLLVPPALLGAALGAAVASRMPDTGIRALLGWVMLGCAVLVVWNPRPKTSEVKRAPSRLRVWPMMFAIGLYGGLIQAGVGYLLLAGLTFVAGLPLLQANILKVVVVFAYTPIALVVFFTEGKVDLIAATALSIGQAIGGWLGASAALKRGERLIRGMLVVAVVGSAVKLLWG